MSIASHIKKLISEKSFIRVMFEKGAELKLIHGADKVFDFSIGNPNVPPPDLLKSELVKAAQSKTPFVHGYTPNTGLPETRRAIAEYVSDEQGVMTPMENIIMTCGAAGGINVALKTLMEPGDEILVPSPYFVEYGHYAANADGKLVTVKTLDDFSLDLDAMAQAIGEKTKVILVNSPNNPTGQIYDEKSMNGLGELLRSKSEKIGRTLYLISDEPYRKIVYDGAVVPSIFNAYENSIVITSFSKDLSIPGERIGYIAVNPNASFPDELLAGMTLTNRTLGFVNAPALIQRAIPKVLGTTVDIGEYARKRELLCSGLKNCGYEVNKPSGTFYLFIKSPLEDDIKFIELLQKQLVLAVPGSAFGCPGYFRLSYCVEDQTILNAMPAFKTALEACQ